MHSPVWLVFHCIFSIILALPCVSPAPCCASFSLVQGQNFRSLSRLHYPSHPCLWEPALPHKMLLSGVYKRSGGKRILSSEHVISTCTLEHRMSPRTEVLEEPGSFHTVSRSSCLQKAQQLFNTQSDRAHQFRAGTEEGDHVQLQPWGTLEEAGCDFYLWCTSLPPNLREGYEFFLIKKKYKIVCITISAKAGFQKQLENWPL